MHVSINTGEHGEHACEKKNGAMAFHVAMTKRINPEKLQILVFDGVKTNAGGGYNKKEEYSSLPKVAFMYLFMQSDC